MGAIGSAHDSFYGCASFMNLRFFEFIHDSWESTQAYVHVYGILNFLYELQERGVDDTETLTS